MSKNTIDYSSLENKVYKKAYRLADVKDQLETVAFDIVKFKDGDKAADLWQIQDAADGQYIVALYDNDDVEVKTACPWEVTISKTASLLQISYKGDPIVRLASAKLGIPFAELYKAEQYLPSKLATNKKLVKSLLNELSESTKQEVLSKYPELI